MLQQSSQSSQSLSSVEHRARNSGGTASGGKTAAAPSRQPSGPNSNKATAAFVRRVLCAHQIQAAGEKGWSTTRPIEELLPPLTSSNEVDLELYAFIAIIVRESISSWYGKITQDHVFVDEIVHIIAHCSRAIEQRLRTVDVESLLLDEIPRLIDDHVTAYRTACEASGQKPPSTAARQVYHVLLPHPSLSPVPDIDNPDSIAKEQLNEETWRQLLVQGVLAMLLPTEDLQNGCLRALVSEILAEMVVGNGICGRACESWLLWEILIKVTEIGRGSAKSGASIAARDSDAEAGRLDRFGLLSTKAELLKPLEPKPKARKTALPIPTLLWTWMQYAYLAFVLLRSMLGLLLSASSVPSRNRSADAHEADVTKQQDHDPRREHDSGFEHAHQLAPNIGPAKAPIVSMSLWSTVSHFVEFEQRMPWLSGLVSLLHRGLTCRSGRMADTNGILDR